MGWQKGDKMEIQSFDESWEMIHRQKQWGAYPSEHVIRFMARNYYSCKERKRVKILDFGCGAGAHTWYLAREGFDTFAFDGSESAVRNTEARLRKDGLTAHLDVTDALSLPYKDAYFDAVIDNVSIQSNMAADICRMYESCYRILKRGGRIFASVFGKDTAGYGTGIQMEPGTYRDLTEGRLQHSGKRHFFDRNELYKILSQCAFEQIQVDEMKYTDGGIMVQQYLAQAVKI